MKDILDCPSSQCRSTSTSGAIENARMKLPLNVASTDIRQ